MVDFPTKAKVVIIGAGIVGNSIAYHLARLGWRDILLIDKGPLPNPGGSTGHASNFIYLVDHNKEMAELTLESARQYKDWDVYTECGGLEVARSETRMNELRRRIDSAKNWGIDSSLVTPAEIKELVPFIDESILVGGFYTPGVGVCDSLQFGTLCREKALEMGALTVFANTEVSAMGVEDGRIRNVTTSRGTVEAEYVVIACGVWAPMIAEMAGAYIPLTPVVHQMADYGPVPVFERSSKAIEYPIVRDMDVLMYERQDGVGFEVGSYAHRSILHDPEEIPSIEEAALSPTEFPFTQEDFDPQLEDALEIFPEILGDERVGQKYAINGLIALTPDGMPLLGETPEVKGLWSAAAVWVKEGPAVGKSIAEWMIHGEPEIDCNQSDISRFNAHQKTRQHTKARAFEAFPKTYGIVHPSEQSLSDRPLRKTPMYEWQVEPRARSSSRSPAGSGRSGTRATPRWSSSYGVLAPRERVGRPLVEPDHQRRAPRDARRRPACSTSPRSRIFDIVGTGRAGLGPEGLRCARWTSRSARSSTRRSCRRRAASSPTSRSCGWSKEHFRVVTGGAHGMADLKWFRDNRRRGRRLWSI